MRKRLDLPIEVENEIRAVNGGHLPRSRAEYVRTAARFGALVRFYPPPFRPEQSSLQDGVIHVPELRKGERPGPYHRHELSEACGQWEGRAPYVVPAPVASNVRHEVARCVDLLAPRRYLTRDLDLRIHQLSHLLAQAADEAGYDVVTIARRPSGRFAILLDYLHG